MKKPPSDSIKLGLGDFVFYSLLVSRAAVHGFVPFLACTMGVVAVSVYVCVSTPTCVRLYACGGTVLRHHGQYLQSIFPISQGLAMTLVLLAIHKKALPALPISIFLGIVFFLGAQYFIVPFVTAATSAGVYI